MTPPPTSGAAAEAPAAAGAAPMGEEAPSEGAAARAARKRRLEEKEKAEAGKAKRGPLTVARGACAPAVARDAGEEAARLERIARKTAERRAAEAEEKARLARLSQKAEARRQAKAEGQPAGGAQTTAAGTEGDAAEAGVGAGAQNGAAATAAASTTAQSAEGTAGSADAGAAQLKPSAVPAPSTAKSKEQKEGDKEGKRENKQAPSGAEVRAARKKRAERRAAGKKSSSTSSSSRRRKRRRAPKEQHQDQDAPCFPWERVERGLTPITASYGSFGVSVTLQEVEEFLKESGFVETQCCQRFRALPAHMQRAVMDRGPVGGCNNPTAILVSRINDAESGIISASCTEHLLDLLPQRKNPEIEQLITTRQLDPNCAARLRALTPAQQKFALTIPLHECKNPSAFILANLDDANMTTSGKIH